MEILENIVILAGLYFLIRKGLDWWTGQSAPPQKQENSIKRYTAVSLEAEEIEKATRLDERRRIQRCLSMHLNIAGMPPQAKKEFIRHVTEDNCVGHK